MSNLINPDQTGFISGRQARDSTIRAIDPTHHAGAFNMRILLLSLDAEKAFDRVDWQFLRSMVKYVGMGPSMVSWIEALYSCPSARWGNIGYIYPF